MVVDHGMEAIVIEQEIVGGIAVEVKVEVPQLTISIAKQSMLP